MMSKSSVRFYPALLAFAVAVLPWVAQAVPRDAGKNDGAILKLQGMVKSLSAERDAAKAENASLAAELAQLKKDKADALAARDSLSSELSSQKNNASAMQNRLGATETRLQEANEKYTQTSRAKADLEGQLSALQARQQATDQQLQACGQHNVKLFQSAQELLDRYQNKGTFSGLLQDEPVLGFQSVEIQNIMQEYQDQLEAGRFTETLDNPGTPVK